MDADLATEHALRLGIWKQLKEEGSDQVLPSRLEALGVYRGQAGVYADKPRTGRLTSDGAGIAMSVLHTGRSYPDDLSEDGVLYHYPSTNRSPAHDANEIQALRWAQRLRLPLFTITPSPVGVRYRRVDLSWVEEYDDEARLVLVAFEEPPLEMTTPPADEEAPFFLTARGEELRALRRVRKGQQHFAFSVFQRYGPRCAVCDFELVELLEAAHVCAKGQGGSNDPRNGLVLCVLHHRAYDRAYWSVDPDSLAFVARPEGPSLDALHVTRVSLAHLPALPHAAALAHGWAQWCRGGYAPRQRPPG